MALEMFILVAHPDEYGVLFPVELFSEVRSNDDHQVIAHFAFAFGGILQLYIPAG